MAIHHRIIEGRRFEEVPRIGTKRWIHWAFTASVVSGTSSGVVAVTNELIGSPAPVPDGKATLLRTRGYWSQTTDGRVSSMLYLPADSGDWSVRDDLILGHLSSISVPTTAVAFSAMEVDSKGMRMLGEHVTGGTGALDSPPVFIAYGRAGVTSAPFFSGALSFLVGFK